ncbi:MAG TPA: hypothetical protein VFP05_02275 [Thermomicrobiales bacterium]|nr:hypothetical protein [Thermomicrobiales bacterium]
MQLRPQEIEIRLTPDDWLLLQDALTGARAAAIKSRIEHSLRSLRREPNGTLSLIFSQQDGDIVTQTLHELFSVDSDGNLAGGRGLVKMEPLPQPLPTKRPAPGSQCQAYRLTAGLPGDVTNRCEQRATQQIQVRHRGSSIPLDLCTQHARQNTRRGRPLYFVVGSDLIGVGHPN